MDNPLKTCCDCGGHFPHTPHYFHRSKKYADGLYRWCKSCEAARRQGDTHKREVLPTDVRRCRMCRQIFTLDLLVRCKGRREGVVNLCVPCGNQDTRQRYHADIEHSRAVSLARHSKPESRARKNARERELYHADIERSRAHARDYYRTHLPERRASINKWKMANPEKIREGRRNWRNANRDHVRALGRKRYASNPMHYRVKSMMRRMTYGWHTKEDIAIQYQKQAGCCFWCSKHVHRCYHVDHVHPISRGGTNFPDNLVIACPACNLSKFNKLPYIEWQPSNPLKC